MSASLTTARLAQLVAEDPTTWSGEPRPSVIVHLDGAAKGELDDHLRNFKASELDGDDVDQANFPLSTTLKEILGQIAIELHQGSGFALVRGLDMTQCNDEDSLVVFLALASFVGDVRGIQDKKKNMISHITDSQNWHGVPAALRHGIHTSTGLPFHNDMGADILALQVRQSAKKGGQTYLASVTQAISELMKADPEAVEILFKPDWPIQVSGSPVRYVLAPLVAYHDGHFMASLDPGRLGLHPATALAQPGITPDLTPAQQHALSALSAAATKHRFCLDAQTGDLIFINNWALLHARDPYEDIDTSEPAPAGLAVNKEDKDEKQGRELRRHYVRLWLRNRDLAWSIPPEMRTPWEAAYGPNGDGHRAYANDKTRLLYPVMPMPEYKVPRYSAGSAAFVLEDSDEEN